MNRCHIIAAACAAALLTVGFAAVYIAHEVAHALASWVESDVPDVINACLEALAVWTMALNVRQLCRDGKLRGVHWGAVAYSVISAGWFMFYYGHLSQWWSLFFAVGYWIAVVTWASFVVAYALTGKVDDDSEPEANDPEALEKAIMPATFAPYADQLTRAADAIRNIRTRGPMV